MQVAQMTELEELECLYCEMHKDVFGVKARWYRAASVEQARKDIDNLSVMAELEAARERAAQATALAKFEARITQTIALGAADRETAIRWIHDAEDTQGDTGYLEWKLGIPYGSIK